MSNDELAAQVNWLNTRMTLAHFVACRDWLDDDPVTTLLIAAVLDANVQHIDQRAAEMKKFQFAGQVPDSLRRPANFLSIAASIGVPRETARARLLGLVERGIFHLSDNGGVLLRSEVIVGDYVSVAAKHLNLALVEFVEAMKRIEGAGLSQEHRLHDPIDECGGVIGRLGASHILRSARLASEVAPKLRFISRLVMLSVSYLTGADFHMCSDPLKAAGGLNPIDPYLDPVSGTDVARHLRLPEETVRRHLLSLTKLGVLERTAKGYRMAFQNPRHVEAWVLYQTGVRVSVDQFLWKLQLGGVIIPPVTRN
jgi:hypothetical protein